MKKYCFGLLAAGAVIPSIACTADYGLGVSLKSSDTSIYFPIRVSDSYRIEPYIRYISSEEDRERDVTSNMDKHTKSGLDIGAGVFRLHDIRENISAYYGIRLAYTESKYEAKYKYGNLYRNIDSKLTGYTLAPTIGFEYSITDKFVVGLEAEWFHINIDGEGKEDVVDIESYTEHTKEEQKSNGTNTRVVFRYIY